MGGDEEITQIPCSCFYKPGKGFIDFYEVFWPEWQCLQTQLSARGGRRIEKFSTTWATWLVQAILVYVHSMMPSQGNKQKYFRT